MSTEKSLIDQIKDLSELEFHDLFGELSLHIRRQKWEHIVNEEFGFLTPEDVDREIEYLEKQNDELAERVDSLREEIYGLNNR